MSKYNHTQKQFAPNTCPYDWDKHPVPLGLRQVLKESKIELVGEMKKGRVDNYAGDRKTVWSNKNLRYDRERMLGGSGHLVDKFTNYYQLQANSEAWNDRLRSLAATGNGLHASQMAFSGSTVASVNLQQPRDQLLSPEKSWVSYQTFCKNGRNLVCHW